MSLVRNTTWNIAGMVIPGLVAIPAMGVMARFLGFEKFGLFTLAFAILGYSSIFDAGLARAVIRSVAMHRADLQIIRRTVGTATCTVFFLSFVAAAVLFAAASPLAGLLKVSPENTADAVSAFCWLSASIPPYLLGLTWFAYLEGQERFAELNRIKIVTNILLACAPLAALLVARSLAAAVIGLVVARIATAAIAYFYCSKGIRARPFEFDRQSFHDLVNFGGWITLTNIVSPVMVYFDRFLLSYLSGAQKIAFYTAPSEAIARMSIVPGAVVRTLFPKLSQQGTNAAADARTGLALILAASLLMSLPVFFLAEQIMTLWLGSGYSGDASTVLQILLVGFVFNSVAQIPFTKMHAQGHAKEAAIVHVCEIVPYLCLLYVLTGQYALPGAAIAWSVRNIVDFAIFQTLSSRIGQQPVGVPA